MSVVGCTISNSIDNIETNTDSGGGIYVTVGTLTMKDTTVTSNRAHYGGGIMVDGGTVNISSSTISGIPRSVSIKDMTQEQI